MKLTSKGRYAVTAILDIALNSEQEFSSVKLPVTLADISARQQISLSYLEQLFSKLRRQGVVQSVRGPGGGYLLGKELNEITIGMIINAVNETTTATKCNNKGNCKGGNRCLTHSLWESLSDHIESFLNQITIEQLISNQTKDNPDIIPCKHN